MAEAQANTRRLLHDEVIGTLTAAADYRGQGRLEVLRACEHIVELLSLRRYRSEASPVSLADIVREAARDATLTVRTGENLSAVMLTGETAEAVRRALREAIRNVSRHAGVDEATVPTWWSQGGHTYLQVTDSGVGTAAKAPRWGLRHSVEQPLARVGGRLDVTTPPGGRGTVVRMSWPDGDRLSRSSPLERAHAETSRAIGGDTSLILKVALPVLAGNSWLAVRYSWGDPQVVAELLLAAAIVGATSAVAERVRRRPLPPQLVLAVTAAAGAATWVGVAMVGARSLTNYDSWVVGLSCVSLTVVAFFVPLGWAMVLALPITLAVETHMVAGSVGFGEGGGALVAAIAPVALGYLLGAFLRESNQSLEVEEQRVQRAAAEVHRRAMDRTVAARQLGHAHEVAMPWLSQVASGTLSLDDEHVRRDARALAVEMRDELHAPGVLDPPLRARIARARSVGTEVVLLPVEGEPDYPGPYLRLLDRALDLGNDVDRILVRLPTREQPGGNLVLVPAVAADRLSFLLRSVDGTKHNVSHDDFSTTISV